MFFRYFRLSVGVFFAKSICTTYFYVRKIRLDLFSTRRREISTRRREILTRRREIKKRFRLFQILRRQVVKRFTASEFWSIIYPWIVDKSGFRNRQFAHKINRESTVRNCILSVLRFQHLELLERHFLVNLRSFLRHIPTICLGHYTPPFG
jgi:hypothetical protein